MFDNFTYFQIQKNMPDGTRSAYKTQSLYNSVQSVTLRKSREGNFGIKLESKNDGKHGAGVFIEKVNPASSSQGKVIPNDRIIVVNGSDIKDKTYQQVIHLVGCSKNGILKLTVLRFDCKSEADSFSFDAFWPDGMSGIQSNSYTQTPNPERSRFMDSVVDGRDIHRTPEQYETRASGYEDDCGCDFDCCDCCDILKCCCDIFD